VYIVTVEFDCTINVLIMNNEQVLRAILKHSVALRNRGLSVQQFEWGNSNISLIIMSACIFVCRQYLSGGTGFGTINGFLVGLGRIYKLSPV
jgi:hypothetical protein